MKASAELLAKLNGRRVVASISGGKDSAALSLHLLELGIEHDRVFIDTGWEHPLTYEHLRGELTHKLGPITEIRAAKQMEELVLHKAVFPTRLRRFCTELLKVKPMQAHFVTRADAGEDNVNAVGIRGAESASRAGLTEWEWSETFDCETWRPLMTWTEEQVILIHKRHGVMPNPLYLKGATRVGCWPCIYARKAEIKLLADIDPGRIDQLRKLERSVGDVWHAKVAARGETPRMTGPTWFQGRGTSAGVMPIDAVVAWAQTEKPADPQADMFAADPRDAGCMRWGMCETSAAGDEVEP